MTYTVNISVSDDEFSGGIAPRGTTLYSRVKHSSSDTGDSVWSDIINFVLRELWTAQPTVTGSILQVTSYTVNYLNAVLLNTNKVFVAYTNFGDGSKIYAVVLTISNNTITAGTIKQCNSVVSTYIRLTVLSTTKVLMCYVNGSGTTNFLESLIVSVADTTITNYAPVALGTIPMSYVASALVDEDTTNSKILVSGRDTRSTSFSQNYTNNNTITVPVGVTSIALSGKGVDGSNTGVRWNLTNNSSTKLVPDPPSIVYETSPGVLPSSISVMVSGVNRTFTYYPSTSTVCLYKFGEYTLTYTKGTALITTGASTTVVVDGSTYTFPGGVGVPASITNYTVTLPGITTYSLVMTIPAGGSLTVSYVASPNRLYSQLVTVNKSTNGITTTTPIECGIRKPLYITSAKLTTNKAIVVYSDESDSGKLYAQIITNSNGIVTASASVVLTNRNCNEIAVYRLLDTSMLVVYKSATDADKLYAQVVTISGTTIQSNSDVQLTNTYCAAPNLVATMNNDKIALVYINVNAGTVAYITVLTVSGTTITNTTPVLCSNDTVISQLRPVMLEPGKMVLTYLSVNINSRIRSQVVVA